MLEAALIGFAFGLIFLRPLAVIVGVELVERYSTWRFNRWVRLHPEEYAAYLAYLRSVYVPSPDALTALLYA